MNKKNTYIIYLERKHIQAKKKNQHPTTTTTVNNKYNVYILRWKDTYRGLVWEEAYKIKKKEYTPNGKYTKQ